MLPLKYSLIILLVSVVNIIHAQEASDVQISKPSFWLGLADNSADFINLNAYNVSEGYYYSELDGQGRVVSDKVYLIALSRMIYAQSYLASQGLADIKRAKASVDFILENMMAEDELGTYLIQQYDVSNKLKPMTRLAINEQAYGLCGLVEYYRVTGDQSLLPYIRKLHKSFVLRFQDSEFGGFFDGYDLANKKPITKKSYASTIYVATAYLINLMEADKSSRIEYQQILAPLVSLAAEHIPDPKTGWIKENFDREWRADWRDWQLQGEYSVGIVGRNFQFAWLLLRASQWDFISPTTAKKYRKIAYESIDNMLTKPSWDSVNGGFLDAFVREKDSPMWNTNKAWWQQAEALMALGAALHFGAAELSDKKSEHYANALSTTANFFNRHFVDRENGGDFFNVTKEGKPLADELKGQKGKSAYHVAELSKFMIEYSN